MRSLLAKMLSAKKRIYSMHQKTKPQANDMVTLIWFRMFWSYFIQKSKYCKEMQKKNIHLYVPNFHQCCFGLTDNRPNSMHWMDSLWFLWPPDSFIPPFPFVVAMGCSLSHMQLTSYSIIPLRFNLKMTFADGNALPQVGTNTLLVL